MVGTGRELSARIPEQVLLFTHFRLLNPNGICQIKILSIFQILKIVFR